MNNIKEYIKNNLNFILCLSISLIITSSCMLLIVFTDNNNTTIASQLTTDNNYVIIINDIANINSELTSCIKNSKLDIDSTKTVLTNSISNLNNSAVSLSKISTDDEDHLELYNDIESCLSSTADLYNYCLNYISTTEKIPIDELADSLDKLKNNCFYSYGTISKYGYSLNCNDSITNFLTAYILYFSKINQINIQKEIDNNKITVFKENLTSITNDFSDNLEDLQPAVERIRDEKRTFDVLLNDLNKCENTFNSLKKDLSQCSIPNGYLSYYNKLNDVFSSYSSYLKLIRTAVIYERSSDYKNDKDTIDKNYTNAFNKYNDVLNELEEFKNLLENC